MSKASETNEESALFPYVGELSFPNCIGNVNIPNLLESQFRKCFDCAIVMTSCDLWDFWDVDIDDPRAIIRQARDDEQDAGEDDASTVCTGRDDDISLYRTTTDLSYYYSANDDCSYLTRDDESLYSSYSCFSTNTGFDSTASRSVISGDDEASKKEEEAYFQSIIGALKRHAQSLGISEVELLKKLEAQQEQIRKEEASTATNATNSILETVAENSELSDETKQSEEDTKPEASDVGRDLEERDKTILARANKGVKARRLGKNFRRRKKGETRMLFQKTKATI